MPTTPRLATLPFAKNDLTSDINGNISGGGGFADSYYVPFILGWNKERVSVRLLYGFLAPTGRYASNASNNVGSGYWTNAISSGQTFSLTRNKTWALSTFEMYEFHTHRRALKLTPAKPSISTIRWSETSPSQSLLCGSRSASPGTRRDRRLPIPAPPSHPPSPPTVTPSTPSASPHKSPFPTQRLNLGMKFFEEFADRSTFQGYSLQFTGVFNF